MSRFIFKETKTEIVEIVDDKEITRNVDYFTDTESADGGVVSEDWLTILKLNHQKSPKSNLPSVQELCTDIQTIL